MQVATQTISRIPRNFYVGISHCRPSLVGRATSPKVPLSRGVTTSVRALARLPAVPVSHSFYVEELLPSFDDVGPLFGRDVAEQLGAPVEDGRAAEDLFFEQPILDDSEIPHRELDGGAYRYFLSRIPVWPRLTFSVTRQTWRSCPPTFRIHSPCLL